MKTLFLHIGTPKTGTSAIQKFCMDNAEVLGNKGYCYRAMPFSYADGASKRRNAHFIVAKVFNEAGELDNEKKEERIEQALAIVAEWFQEKDNVILTDESLWNHLRGKRLEYLERLKDFCQKQGAQLKLIVYLRRQDDFLYSTWKQRIGIGMTRKTWDIYVSKTPRNILLDYDEHLKSLEEIVGHENLLVRRYEKGNFLGENHTIFSDFLDVLGLEFSDEYLIEQDIVNPSIDDNLIEIKRILNYLQAESVVANNDISMYFEKAALACMHSKEEADRKSMFTPEEQREFLEKYEQSNRQVLEKYFPGEDVLFHDNVTELPKWDKNNVNLQDDVILFFGQLALNQKQEIADLRKELKDANEELKSLKEFRELCETNIFKKLYRRIKRLVSRKGLD